MAPTIFTNFKLPALLSLLLSMAVILKSRSRIVRFDFATKSCNVCDAKPLIPDESREPLDEESYAENPHSSKHPTLCPAKHY